MKKDAGRFDECYEKYHRLIMFVVLEKTSDFLLAEEIVQEVFCEFYVYMEKIRPRSEKPWLLRCAWHKMADQQRSRQRWSELVVTAGRAEIDNLLVEETALSCEERLELEEFAGRILRQVKAFNVLWYEALELCFVEELSYAEAAERLNISTSVLRSRICRARAYVRKKFWNEYKKGESE